MLIYLRKRFYSSVIPGPQDMRGQTSPAAVIGGVVAFIVLFAVFVGTWASVPPDKIMLHYTGGPMQGTHFKEVLSPGHKLKFLGLLENTYSLPATQRTYIISADPNVGDRQGVDVITANSAAPNSVPMTFEATVYFKLNPKPEVLRQFFEQICLHDHCTDLGKGGGWDQMLGQYFRPALEQALRTEAGKYQSEALWHDPDVRAHIQTAIGPVLAADINSNIGGDFFCGADATTTSCPPFGFVLQGATPPQSVVDAFAATAAVQKGIDTAKAQAEAKIAAANGDAQAQAARAAAPAVPPQASDYIRAQAMATCATRPDCHLVIVQGGTSTVQVAP